MNDQKLKAMEKLSGKLYLTKSEAEYIVQDMRHRLASEWEAHTSRFIVGNVSEEDGMKRMDPHLYDLMNKLESRIFDLPD